MNELDQLKADYKLLEDRIQNAIKAYKELREENFTLQDELNSLKYAKPPADPKPEKEVGYADEIYKAYPRKDDKKRAIIAIVRAVKALKREGGSSDTMLTTVKQYASCIKRFEINSKHKDWKLVPMAATWFNKCRYEQDESEWSAPFRKGNYVAPARTVDIPDEPDNWREDLKELFPMCDPGRFTWKFFCENMPEEKQELKTFRKEKYNR